MSVLRVVLAMVAVTAAAGLMVAGLQVSAPPSPTPTVTAQPTTASTQPLPAAVRVPAAHPSPSVVGRPATDQVQPAPTPTRQALVGQTIRLEPRAAPPGAQVRLSGAGFAPLDRLAVVLIREGRSVERSLGALPVAADGQVSDVITLPFDLPLGRYVVRALQADGEAAGADLWAVREEGRLDLRSYAAHPGGALDLAGAGFAPGEAVRVYLADSAEHNLASLIADQHGSIVGSAVKVPDVVAGVHTLVAEGEQTGVAVRRQFGVLGFAPWIVLSTYTLRTGGGVDVSGQGFAPGEEIQVRLDDAEGAALTLQADGDGRTLARSVFVARPQDVGKHWLALVGGRTQTPVSAAFEVLPYVPRLALTSYAGPPGAEVAFSGEGFAPGETIRVYLERGDRREQVALFLASAGGAFQGAGTYPVPEQTADGKLHFVVVGDLSRVPVSQDFSVQTLNPWAELSVCSGPVGATLHFRGLGFAAGEQVEARLGDLAGPVVAAVTADAQGNFGWAGPLTLPAEQTGSVSLIFVGVASQSSARADYYAVAPPSAANQ